MGTFTKPIPQISLYRAADMRKETPLAKIAESFFISNRMSPKTRRFYQTHLTAFGRFLLEQLGREGILGDLNREYVNAYVRKLEETPTAKYPKGSPFRARAAAVTLKRLGNWLVEEGVFKGESPLRKVKKPKDLGDVRQPLSDEELVQVLDSAGEPGSRNHAMVAFLAGTGLRLNELRELRISDIHLGDCEVNIRAETCKVGVARTVVFHEDVARVVDKYLRSRDAITPSDPLFPTDMGTQFKEESIGKVFQRLADFSGIRRFHAHLLRHTWATNFMRSPGNDLLTLKRQGGWKRMDMVERYSHPVQIRDRAALPNPMSSRSKITKFAPRSAEWRMQ